MKKFVTLLPFTALFGCASGNGPLNLGYVFPPGSSEEILDAQLVVTGTGGTLTARSIKIVGTNGFQVVSTNSSVNTIAVPAGTLMQVK